MKKLCVILSEGIIPELGNLRGPVVKPTKIDTSIIISLVNNGFLVEEVNPRNYNERVRLTFANINSNNFLPKKKKETPVTYNSYKLPEGKRSTVVESVGEAEKVAQLKKTEKKEATKKETPVKSSDF